MTSLVVGLIVWMCYRAPIPSVINLGSTAGKEVSTWAYHVFRKRILLAVEHEGGTVVVQSFLGVAAFSLEVFHSAVLFVEILPPLWFVVQEVDDVVLVLVELVLAVIEV